jgi:hypothetical protein
METLWSDIKDIGESAFPILGIVLAFVAMSPTAQNWFKRMEECVMSVSWLRKVSGVPLLVFCAAYIVASNRVHRIQAEREAARVTRLQARIDELVSKQSPVYQRQILLGVHINDFVTRCKAFAKDYARDPVTSNTSGQSWLLGYRFAELEKEMDDCGGIDRSPLDKVCQEENQKVMTGGSWLRIANECDKISKQLRH